ncbi:MAG TPA: transposase [Gaiellaceae bacterium]|nr:transposase [Gaiellaceae bacterium]
MGRPPRTYHSDGIYHLTQHGIDDRVIYRDDVDRQDFTLRLARTARAERWDLRAACLMDTHYHLLVQPLAGRISEGMRNLNGGFARAFNRRHERRGAVFEARYREWTIRDEEHLATTIRYIDWNPVMAEMVQSIEDWPWTTAWDSPFRRCLTLRKGV